MNADIVRLLREVAHLRGPKSQAGIAFENAARSVESLNYNVRTRGKVVDQRIRGVGPSIGALVDEFIATGSFKGHAELVANAAIRDRLTKIIGVGEVTAAEFIAKGIKSVDDLRREVRAGTITLTTAQSYGLKYYDDLNTRIPRSEIIEIETVIRGKFARLTGDHRTRVEICGSYRRGAATSGDIDVIVCRDLYKPTLLKDFADALGGETPIIASGREKLSYLYKHSERMRQIDVLLVRKAQFPSALLYFTGSWQLNAAMRRIAAQKGYRLNEHGLFRIKNGKVSKTSIRLMNEKSIFDALGLEYLEPYERAEPPKSWSA